eukprot:CAMPEP_0183369792 /NCGR_PEP_ID=MMETSP0164_2-20130417/100622_1 /TAXON_ID=221442 /ORGANISM="Coccolithus pelagicus ssp braarudi, Strain PLY182g" /LENGTH=36 /DNA_ID= /DNA_START= /DNA_END= /DNA_ORIENTATION=
MAETAASHLETCDESTGAASNRPGRHLFCQRCLMDE